MVSHEGFDLVLKDCSAFLFWGRVAVGSLLMARLVVGEVSSSGNL